MPIALPCVPPFRLRTFCLWLIVNVLLLRTAFVHAPSVRKPVGVVAPAAAIVPALPERARAHVGFVNDPAARDRALAWADRLYARHRLHAMPDYRDYYRRKDYGVPEVQQAYGDILQKYGPCARGYAGLARCRLLLDQYAGAQRDFEKALQLAPRSRRLKRELARSRQVATVARAIGRTLSHGDKVWQVRQFPVPGAKGLWVALTANVEEASEEGSDHDVQYIRASKIRLGLYRMKGDDCRQLWRSDIIKRADSSESDFDDVLCYVHDATGDGVPDVLVHCGCMGVDWDPSHLSIFALRKRRLESILSLDSDDMISTVRSRSDGRYLFSNYYKVCSLYAVPFCGRMMWSDVYAFDGWRFSVANRHYPALFKQCVGELKAYLAEHPDDYAVHERLSEAYTILGHPGPAALEYRRAIRACDRLLKMTSKEAVDSLVDPARDRKRLAAHGLYPR